MPPSAPHALRRLFLRLFLRGRPRTQQAWERQRPLWRTGALLLVYVLVGGVAATTWRLDVFERATTLHAFTFLMVGMMLAGFSGTLLFNAKEADILLHRPVTPRALLAAKLQVLVLVALCLSVAMNITGLAIGVWGRHSTWLFAPAHVIALTLEVIFACSVTALVYGWCLQRFGRRRLDDFITLAQVLVAVLAMIGGQIVPRVLSRLDLASMSDSWPWLLMLPPAWFGALTAVLAGVPPTGWLLFLAGLAVGMTGLAAWWAVGRLSGAYGEGLVALNEAGQTAVFTEGKGRGIFSRVEAWIARVWLRDPIERAAFTLTAAGLRRARDVKLRVYPQLAQLAVYPLIFLAQPGKRQVAVELPAIAVALAGAVSATMVFNTIEMLRYADHWRAADIFRTAPLRSPAPLFHGLRKAVLLLLCGPLMIMLSLLIGWWKGFGEGLLLLLPGFIAMPFFAMLPGLGRMAVPFSEPPEHAKNMASGCARVILVMGSALVIAGVAVAAHTKGWLGPLLILEANVVFALTWWLRRSIDQREWEDDP